MGRRNDKKMEWELTRQRFRIASPVPPRPTRPEKQIGDILSEMNGEEPAKTTLPEALESRWPILVGEQVAQHSHPATLRGSRLTVFVDHHGWLAELRRYPVQALLKKIAAIPDSPTVTDIRFQLDPDLRTRRR